MTTEKTDELRIAYLTAGAAGMYCGSCLRDNALAAALTRRGADVTLIPTYTPIRVDEPDASTGKVFFGGINVYLQQRSALFRKLPRWLDRWLDRPGLINRLAGRGLSVDAKLLGEMTVSMLRGAEGNQRKEVARLVDWLAADLKPQVVNFSNMLIAGCAPEVRRRLGSTVFVTMQGDDIFLDDLAEPYRSQALAEIERLADFVDGFVTFSDFYADRMASELRLPRERFHIVPLGLHMDQFPLAQEMLPGAGRHVGYLARICEAKGLHILVDAFVDLAKRPGFGDVDLHAAGWLGESDKPFLAEQVAKLARAGLADRFTHHGVLDHTQKLAFLRRLDVLSVPTVYREPKGLFVLEALSQKVPVVQPEHGAFPELLASTGGGRLHRPHDAAHLADTLADILGDHDGRGRLGADGHDRVRLHHTSDAMAARTLEVYRRVHDQRNARA